MLNTLVLCDETVAEVDAVYLFGQTVDNQESVLQKGVEIAEGQNIPLVICGSSAVSGYPGFEAWKQELMGRGIDVDNIIGTHPVEPLNTLTEAIGLVQEAKRKQWKTITIVAAPFHQLRAFMSVVHALTTEYPSLKVYNQVGSTLNWNEVVFHNQGTNQNVRRNFIESERERIQKYHGQGNLPDVKDVLAYLQNR